MRYSRRMKGIFAARVFADFIDDSFPGIPGFPAVGLARFFSSQRAPPSTTL
jgi:hypothetical protein